METPGGGESASSRARLEDAGQFVSAGDSQRELFLKHPWSIGGGGASELKEKLETENETRTLQTFVSLIGFVAMTRADDVYFADSAALRRCRI